LPWNQASSVLIRYPTSSRQPSNAEAPGLPTGNRGVSTVFQMVDVAGRALTVGRAINAGGQSSTKSGRGRRVPLPDQAAAAVDRMCKRRGGSEPDSEILQDRVKWGRDEFEQFDSCSGWREPM
jgi:hypothetical protein